MTKVFADTLYWLALALPRDQWRTAALAARTRLGTVQVITTEEVFVEFFNGVCRSEPPGRQMGLDILSYLGRDPSVTVVPQSHESFAAGVDLYGRRPDKTYSLTDCISMETMRRMGITDVLTNDAHFAQEGFKVLIER